MISSGLTRKTRCGVGAASGCSHGSLPRRVGGRHATRGVVVHGALLVRRAIRRLHDRGRRRSTRVVDRLARPQRTGVGRVIPATRTLGRNVRWSELAATHRRPDRRQHVRGVLVRRGQRRWRRDGQQLAGRRVEHRMARRRRQRRQPIRVGLRGGRGGEGELTGGIGADGHHTPYRTCAPGAPRFRRRGTAYGRA